MYCFRFILYGMLFAGLFGCVSQSADQPGKTSKADYHYRLGASQLQANNPTQALKELLAAVKLEPKDSNIQAALAQAYMLKKAYPQAEEHYLLAIKLSDNDPRYQHNLASLYLSMERWDDAIKYFELASSNLLFSNSHVALTGEGFAYFKKKDYDSALQQYEKVIDIAPRYAPVYLMQSEVYLAQGNKELARRALEKATDVDTGFVQAIYQLGIIALQEQELADARTKFQKVLDLAPNSDWGMKSQEILRSLEMPEPNL